MKKFILWISLSMFLGIALFFTLNQTRVQAVVVGHDECPPTFSKVLTIDEDILEQFDRNGDSYVCSRATAANKKKVTIIDNNAGYPVKKKVVK